MGIKTNTEFDQIFRDALHDHEVSPPEHVWENIQSTGLDATVAKSSNWKWWAAASALVIFLSTTAYLYNSSDDSAMEDKLIVKTENTNQINPEPKNETVVVDEIAIEKTPEEEVSEAVVVVPQVSEINEAKEINTLNQMVFEEEVIASDDQMVILDDSRLDDLGQMKSTEKESLSISESSTQDLAEVENTQQASKAGYDFFDDDAIDEITEGHLYDKYWELGLEFSPEWITIPDNNNNIESYGFDLSAKYYLSKWFVETGLGFAFSKDNGDYDVDYQEALFKGSYEDVYNVTFDTTNGTPIPTYYTKTVNIYDTIDRVNVSENKNSYAYLNIPLNFGYATKLGEKFSFYAKLGVNASFKIYENIPEPTIIGENVTILKVTPLYHERTSWHLATQISAGIDYHITDKFLFGVEPNARYYVKSLVEDNSGGNPYGLGVKIGFKYVIK